MLVSLKWLRDYVSLPAALDIDDLAHRLTMASAEVDGIHRVGGEWDRALVVVGHVLEVAPHPNADRLRLATVDFGGAAPQQVVCGAPNLAQGQHIAFAREGAKVIDGHSGKPSVLKKGVIRGVESAGMVLSEMELGLSQNHEGIIVLPADAPVGTPVVDYLGDVVLDVHVWPNRADMMSMTGVAREVAAIVGGTLSMPDAQTVTRGSGSSGGAASDAVSVRIDDPALCARYIATVIEGVTVGPSPEWMQARLRAAGMRPINNVVDVTNYVILELGQPLHAFDLDRVSPTGKAEIGVRTAKPGETLRTLDGVDRVLTPDTLLVTDTNGPIALAGVMGGEATEVTAGTKRILLESARFDPVSIRRTGTRLALRSEASARFERGLSPELALAASQRATQLLVEVAGGTARVGRVDAYPAPYVAPEVSITRARLDTVIGFHVPTSEVEAILTTLGFDLVQSDGGSAGGLFVARVPWWRTDISIPDDLAEEVVRLAGFDRLPATGMVGAIPAWEPAPILDLRNRLSDALVAAGLQEIISYSLTTTEVLERVIPREDLAVIRPLRLKNTQSADRELMRPTLRHSLLETVARNLNAGGEQVAIFEAARAFIPVRDGGHVLPEEHEQVTGALAGFEVDRWGRATARRLDFFDAKGALEAALGALGVTTAYVSHEEYGLLPGHVARLDVAGQTSGTQPFGLLGEVHPDTLDAFGIGQPVLLFEIDLARLLPHLPKRRATRSLSRFPAVTQDLAVVVDDAVTAGALQAIIEQSSLVVSASVFDVFKGGRLPVGKKSVALSIRFQAADRTLTSDDANKEQARILKRLEREFGAEQRT